MIVRHTLPVRAGRPLALAVGSFDGVHRGHAAVLRALTLAAEARGYEPAVLTFEPLPREYFRPADPPPRLTRLGEKLPRLAALGIARTVVLRFDERLAAIVAEAFVDRVLVAGLGARLIAVGEDFRFGHGRKGDLALLRERGARHGLELLPVPAVRAENERVSSSRIREHLAAGDLAAAARLLGRPYTLTGRVIHGRGLARRLGCPTANLAPGRRRLALRGVFAVRVSGADSNSYNGVASLGVRPGFGDGRELIEVHLFDYAGGPLYGRRLEVVFVARLRDEWTFDSTDALARQIARDVQDARRVLAAAPPATDGGSPTVG
jgi:riboflavin kinase/FMN adenylyltransferase